MKVGGVIPNRCVKLLMLSHQCRTTGNVLEHIFQSQSNPDPTMFKTDTQAYVCGEEFEMREIYSFRFVEA